MTSSKQTIKAVLFDLDGTLLDTADDLGAALNAVLNKYNYPAIAAKDYRPIASDGAKGLLELGFADDLHKYDFATLRQEFLTYYEHNIAVHTSLYPGISSLLEHLNKNNIPWGIVTNKPEYLTLLLLPNFAIFKHCQIMLGGDSLPQRKPDPAPLLHCLKHLSIAPEACFYVGDAPRDIAAGKNAKMPTIIAGWGYIPDFDDCANWQADYFVAQPQLIIPLIK